MKRAGRPSFASLVLLAPVLMGLALPGVHAGHRGAPPSQGEAAEEPLPEVDAEARAAATAVLDAVSKHLREVEILRAAYVQERTSPLLIEPLTSRGTLFQRTEPACLVFQVATPHRADIRVDAKTYQVHRPEEATAERFVFEGTHAGKALLQALRPEAKSLYEAFFLVAWEAVEDRATLTLRPRVARARKLVDHVELTLDTKRKLPHALRYVDRDGHSVRLTLSDVRLDPELEDPTALFRAELPKGVRLLVHRLPDRE